MCETRVWSLGQEDPLEKEMATHSSILAWRIPWTEEPGRLQSTGLQRVGLDWATSLHFKVTHTGLEKVSFHSNPKEGQCHRMFKLPHNVPFSHDSKVMFKILQARLQQYRNWGYPEVQAGFRKGRGTRDQIANICWIIEKAREFQKNIYFCFMDYAKAFDCVDHSCGKVFKRCKYQSILPASWEIFMQVSKQQLEWTGSKLGMNYVKAVYRHHVYLT